MEDLENLSFPCPSCGKGREIVASKNVVVFEQYTTKVISSKCSNTECFLHDKVCDFYNSDNMRLIGE